MLYERHVIIVKNAAQLAAGRAPVPLVIEIRVRKERLQDQLVREARDVDPLRERSIALLRAKVPSLCKLQGRPIGFPAARQSALQPVCDLDRGLVRARARRKPVLVHLLRQIIHALIPRVAVNSDKTRPCRLNVQSLRHARAERVPHAR